MIKNILILLTFTMSISTAYASRSQIITMPDGTTMVCYYYNGGRIVECVKL